MLLPIRSRVLKLAKATSFAPPKAKALNLSDLELLWSG